MRWIIALTALLLVTVAVFAQEGDTCIELRTKLRDVDSTVEFMKVSNENNFGMLHKEIADLKKQLELTKTELYQNQDINAKNLDTRLTNRIIERTDPMKNVIPFICGFLFSFFLCAAIVIKYNLFMLRHIASEE